MSNNLWVENENINQKMSELPLQENLVTTTTGETPIKSGNVECKDTGSQKNNSLELIQEFVNTLKDKTGHIPKFAHNLNPDNKRIFYSAPMFDDAETVACLNSFLYGSWASSGEDVQKFENEFSKKIGSKQSLMVNSGSSANLVMLAALKEYFKWTSETEILTSVVGFPTTATAIIQNNLKAIFVDIEFDTLNFSLFELEQKITQNTKAIFLSPVLGNPPDIDKIIQICEKYNLKLILDGCDSLGTKWRGLELSKYAIATSCSFYISHTISTLEGGMVSSDNEEIINIARGIAWWGRACFKADTQINVKEGSKKISEIQVGDEVFTHKGNYKKVKEIIKIPYQGDYYTFSCKQRTKIHGSAEHPFYILRDNKFQWIEAKDIKRGDYFTERVPDYIPGPRDFKWSYFTDNTNEEKINKVLIEPDLMRLIGYWLAEGSATKALKGKSGYTSNRFFCYTVSFDFNSNEKQYLKDVKFLIKKYFDQKTYIRKGNGNGVSISVKSRKLFEFFHQFFGDRAWNKKLPNFFVNLDLQCLKELIKGIWRGDGNYSPEIRSFNIAITSFELIEQIRRILLRFDITCSYHIRTPDKHAGCIVNGKPIIARRNLYYIATYNTNTFNFAKLLDNEVKIKEFDHLSNYFSDDKKYALYKIKSVEKEKIEEFVYNLEVEDDESYHCQGVAVHNCYCVAKANFSQNGCCGKRWSNWIPELPELLLDHKYLFNYKGYNLKPLDLCGAIGLEQLKKLDLICKKRKENRNKITEWLQEIPGIRFPKIYENADVCWFGTPVLVENNKLKNKLVQYLEKNFVQVRNYFAGNLTLQPAFKDTGNWKDFPEANKVLERVFFIGCSPTYTEDQLNYLKTVIENFKNE